MSWVLWVAVVGAGLIVVCWPVAAHNRLVSMQATVVESWRGIDVELTRRWDLVPGLADVARAYAAHEAAVLDRLAARRAPAALDGSPSDALRELHDHVIAEESRSDGELGGALTELRALAEAQPELRSSQHYAELMRMLRDTEDRIAAARRLYNGNVARYNARLRSFPASILARRSATGPAEYWVIRNEEHAGVPPLRLRDEG